MLGGTITNMSIILDRDYRGILILFDAIILIAIQIYISAYYVIISK
jgi:hypothetical protein